jgi:hypothetical protein
MHPHHHPDFIANMTVLQMFFRKLSVPHKRVLATLRTSFVGTPSEAKKLGFLQSKNFWPRAQASVVR